VLPAQYLLPLRSSRPVSMELAAYLRGIRELMPVIVVDGSDPDVFEATRRALPFAVHIAPDAALRCANGKVHGVLTGLRHVTAPAVVIADDDVRYGPDALRRSLDALDGADLVRPQNYFDPLPWHAVWDTARTLLNRALGADFPGTLVVRTATIRRAGGYDGDVLFENLELMRTIEAVGGRCVHRPDIYVRRLPPTTRHFRGQRVRQAYDELARPARMAAQLAIVPVMATLAARRRGAALAGLATAAVVVAERGRLRADGRRHFPPAASLCAPVWLLERGVCAWCALGLRRRGGVRYAGGRLVRAATPMRELRRRVWTARALGISAPRVPAAGATWTRTENSVATSSGEQPEQVVLELPREAGATSVAVAGDFNGWSVTTHEMRQRDDGCFAITLELQPGRTYCYRYWVDGCRWENDWSADAYVPNEFGGDNSMIDLRDSSPRLQKKTPVAHEPPAVGSSAPDTGAEEPGVPIASVGKTEVPATKPKKATKSAAPARTRAPRAAPAEPTT
jgi:predicted carbohydrate-binding protein with CBM48